MSDTRNKGVNKIEALLWQTKEVVEFLMNET